MTEEVKQDIDPELVDDRDVEESDTEPVELPDYDPTQFELPEDYEDFDEDEEEGDE